MKHRLDQTEWKHLRALKGQIRGRPVPAPAPEYQGVTVNTTRIRSIAAALALGDNGRRKWKFQAR